jgi:hypothetical protein
MGRQPRLIADGLVYQAPNRGNNRSHAFFHDAEEKEKEKEKGTAWIRPQKDR